MSHDTSERILILAPTGKDSTLIASMLSKHGLAVEICSDMPGVCDAWNHGVGAILVAEEALDPAAMDCLLDSLGHQPPWSDLPIIIMTGGGKATRYSTRVAEMLQERGNVTLLERPLRMLTLLSALSSALRARRRQYQVRNLLTESQAAVQQRDQFLAMLGHELRNPHAAIRTSIEILSRFGFNDESLAREQLDIIKRQSSNVARLVDDLLDVARVTMGKIVLERALVDVREIARRSFDAIKLATGEQRHEVIYDSCAEPAVVNADAVRIEQVITNLLSNAYKYTPQGGKIWLKVRIDKNDVVVSVRDTGEGIPTDLLPKIFEPFVQSKQSLARSSGGLGIGLTVVSGLVEMHGGTIAACSEGPGHGSEFVVRLPLEKSPPPAPAADQKPRSPGATHVLVVEDSPDARNALVRLLTLLGHRVESAADGTSAVEKAIASHPQVALVDIGLPGMDGYEVARRIRSVLGDSVHLIALTGYGQTEDRRRAESAGFDLHVVKPLDPSRLDEILTPARRPALEARSAVS